MTCLAEKKVESRVRNIFRARDMAEQGVPRPFAVTDWRENAVTRFFTDNALDSDAVPNTTIVLPGLYGTSDAGACLKDALYAAAFGNEANQLGLKWMAIEAKAAYGRALASLSRVLQDPVEALKDTTLATPFVIGLYKVRPILGLPYIRFEKREADCPGTGYQWLPANRYSDGSSSPPWSNVIASPSWQPSIQLSDRPMPFRCPA